MNADITLACGHDRALSQLRNDGKAAWCYVCEQVVEVRNPVPPQAAEGEDET